MSITASAIAEDALQSDGRRAILEIHTDHTGKTWPRRYMAGASDNLQTGLAARAAELEAFLTQQEIDANLAALEAGG